MPLKVSDRRRVDPPKNLDGSGSNGRKEPTALSSRSVNIGNDFCSDEMISSSSHTTKKSLILHTRSWCSSAALTLSRSANDLQQPDTTIGRSGHTPSFSL